MTRPSILEETRRVRHAISAEHGHDPKRMLAYYENLQSQVRARIVNLADQGPYGRTKPCADVADQPIPDGTASATNR